MDHKQYEEFQHIARQCESGEYRSINVGSKIRSDAIVAVWHELNVRSIESRQLRAALYELVKVADPETNMSMIPLLDALARARRTLGTDELEQQERDALQVRISENVPDTMVTTPYDFELRDRRLRQNEQE